MGGTHLTILCARLPCPYLRVTVQQSVEARYCRLVWHLIEHALRRIHVCCLHAGRHHCRPVVVGCRLAGGLGLSEDGMSSLPPAVHLR